MHHERLVYVNGRMVAESEAAISVFDLGLLYGVTIFESLRTFKHRWFQQDEHWTRFQRSLRYAGLDGLVTKARFEAVLRETLQANLHLTEPEDDVWGSFQVTPGRTSPMPLLDQHDGEPTVICYTCALPHSRYARCFSEGKRAVTSLFRTPPPQCHDQRMKSRARLPHFLSKQDAKRFDPGAFALMLDTDGFIAEGTGANIFFVLDGVLRTPRERNILAGISRQYVLDLARELGMQTVVDDLTLYDAYAADEAFWTTTSYCLLPVSAIDGRQIGERCPGPVAQRLLDVWSRKVGVDIAGQARRFAGQAGS